MARYRKKPVVIEAVKFTGILDNGPAFEGTEYPVWIEEAFRRFRGRQGSIWVNSDGTLMIGTLESPHEASPGDWIIQGIKGELYPCKPDIFDATYEPA